MPRWLARDSGAGAHGLLLAPSAALGGSSAASKGSEHHEHKELNDVGKHHGGRVVVSRPVCSVLFTSNVYNVYCLLPCQFVARGQTLNISYERNYYMHLVNAYVSLRALKVVL